MPLGFVLCVVVSFVGMAKWVGQIDAQQDTDREMRTVLVAQLVALTEAVKRGSEDAAATRAQVQMIVRELDKRPTK